MIHKDQTLDLTAFNRANFAGVIRIRHLADWANDYWAKGLKLARVKLFSDEYRALIREIRDDNRFLTANPDDTVSIDLGFGDIEIINVTEREYYFEKLDNSYEMVEREQKIKRFDLEQSNK